MFVSLSVKATHLELVSDLTSQAFVAALRRFIARRGKPRLLWIHHGSNFVRAAKDLADLIAFLSHKQTQVRYQTSEALRVFNGGSFLNTRLILEGCGGCSEEF